MSRGQSILKYRWGVIVTDPLMERKAALNLVTIGIKSYCPTIWNGYVRQVLFANYLFGVVVKKNWRQVYTTRGCRRWLGPMGFPGIIDSSFISRLKAMENSQGNIILPPKIVHGEKVVFSNGPFIGNVGLYQEQTASEREGVLLSLLGQSVLVPAKQRDLERATA